MKKRFILCLLAMAICTSMLYPCDMVMVMARKGGTLNDALVHNGIQDLVNSLNSTYNGYAGTVRHGRGLVLYNLYSDHTRPGNLRRCSHGINSCGPGDTLIVSDRKWARCHQKHLLSTFSDRMNVSGEIIYFSELKQLWFHRRESTVAGTQMVANPHPFVYRTETKSYTFMHNGSITGTALWNLQNYYNQNPDLRDQEIEKLLILDEFGINLLGQVDSALMFAVFMKHIKEADWDILQGLNNALSKHDLWQGAVTNFILSEGNETFVFRSSHIPDPTKHLLRVGFYNDRSVAITSLPSSRYTFPSFIPVYNLEPGDMIYIPVHGPYVRFKNFTSHTNQIMLRKPVRASTWDSFPVIPVNSFAPFTKSIVQLEYNNSNSIYYEDNLAHLSRYGWKLIQINGNTLSYVLPDFIVAEPNLGMKIGVGSSLGLNTLSGKLAPVTNYTGTFYPGETYWVTYNLSNEQSMRDAFGSTFSKIQKVEAEGWVYNRLIASNQDPSIPVDVDNLITRLSLSPMEFGKTYIITLRENVQPIVDFGWKNSRISPVVQSCSMPLVFNIEYGHNYEALNILGLSELEEECVEIGVFVGEACIGATRVDSFPIQILVYSENYEGEPLTVRAAFKNGIVSEIDPSVLSFSKSSGTFENISLVAGEIGFMIATLDIDPKKILRDSPSIVIASNVYPNPFNPTTTLSFNLSERSAVTIDIYNIRGQHVKRLFDGNLFSGNHFIKWNGTNTENNPVSSGVYFYRINADRHSATGKMVLMK
jgi:predicted glutamine amidotransferase